MNKSTSGVFRAMMVLMLAITLISASCNQAASSTPKVSSNGTKHVNALTVMFYNVENLFDIYNDPKTEDDDFTPSGKLVWTNERYNDKLGRIAQVIDGIPGDLPAFVGLAEIENKKVLIDLLRENTLADSYKILHKDSPDERGIDVAALIDTTLIQVEYYNYTTINLPNTEDPYTRDLLYVKGSANSETIHFFVNHWPSRGGGQQETEKNRVAVANVLDSQVRKILQSDKNAKVIIMGDFNDHPNDKSIAQVLGAGTSKKSGLYNYMFDYHAKGNGSYWYKGEWGALDQFITSSNLKFGKSGWTSSQAFFYDDTKVMFTDKEGNQRPNRTYAGEKYIGGFSDHLAIYLPLEFQ